MIKVSIDLSGITVQGHARHGPKGGDIVCAAMSALTDNLINSLESLTQDEIEYEIQSGYVRIGYRNLSEAGKLLVDSFFIGISAIENNYGCVEIVAKD